MEILLPLLLGFGLLSLFSASSSDSDPEDSTPDTPPLPTDGDDAVVLTGGPDLFLGTDGDDNIDGGEGFDTLSGGEGNDTIEGGRGKDSVSGGSGYDTLSGGAWNDTLDGGSGFDDLDGGDGNDILFGGLGKDLLEGDGGNDVLHGGEWIDGLFGGDGDDTLVGDVGDDILNGGDGIDILSGGDGDDIGIGGDGADTIFGGDGDDLLLGSSFPSIDPATFRAIRDGSDLDEFGRDAFLAVKGGDGYFDSLVGGNGDDFYYLTDEADEARGSHSGKDTFIVFSELGEALDGEGDVTFIHDTEEVTIDDPPGVMIHGFNPSEDVLVILHDGATATPVLSFEEGAARLNRSYESSYVVNVFADGIQIATVSTDESVSAVDVQAASVLQVI
ncbi:calcium-binding protein [Octadecabacter ascidiaceicola]|uniref:Hemolysin, chromosomal n=1 Tax=Octadecabacter ascidiaceicola TaxID=1655543 RepID=A0A238JMV9_9RHOB|nr:hypothetical protein [Octadecabacter ascidiaceicola]SMX31544.1 Hemolysin, chromosomal [Octadecabacter ascidiaceicola]